MTFSVVARDPASGWLGVATATGNLAVGAQVPHARSGLGAIACQGFATNPNYRAAAFALLGQGRPAADVVSALCDGDDGRGLRQLAVVDAQGRSAGFTGAENFAVAGHLCRENLALAGNYLAAPAILERMADAFAAAAGQPFGDRLLGALAAGQAAGGDRRGTFSAALAIDSGGPVPLDLRVDYAEDPVAALDRLYRRALHPDYQAFLARLPRRQPQARP